MMFDIFLTFIPLWKISLTCSKKCWVLQSLDADTPPSITLCVMKNCTDAIWSFTCRIPEKGLFFFIFVFCCLGLVWCAAKWSSNSIWLWTSIDCQTLKVGKGGMPGFKASLNNTEWGSPALTTTPSSSALHQVTAVTCTCDVIGDLKV